MTSPDFATGCSRLRAFVVADLHLGDERVARARGFKNAAAMAAEIVARWDEVVSPTAPIYLLGDVAKRGHLGAVRTLCGEKHLVCGNADDIRDAVSAGIFASVAVTRSLPGFLLTHIPVHPSQLRDGAINVHGHLHRASIPDTRYRCVSVDQTAYAPVPIASLARQPGQDFLF